MTASFPGRHLGVIGWPVAQSLSPRLHNHWLRQHKIDAAYQALPVQPEALAETLRALPERGFIGVNITIPHKEAACRLVDTCDAAAAAVGAINTIRVDAQGALHGSNTDVTGFATNVRNGGHDFRAGPALVLGAGGAARAVLAALSAEGCPQIYLTNRTRARAEQLAAQHRAGRTDEIRIIAWEQRATILPDIKLLVNTTALGMMGQDPLALDLTTLPPDAAVNDLVYKPLQTPLLAAASARNLRTIDGLGMLLYQAQAAFHIWFGITPAVTPELRDYVLTKE
ncbi:MAG: shikimate dehydrogenase [Alphaproteobacteria bacterium]